MEFTPPEDRCVEVSHPKRIPEIFVGRLLSDADREELYQIRQRAQQGEAVRQLNAGETSSGPLERLVLEIAEIRDALDDVVVRFNRRQDAIAAAENARTTTLRNRKRPR